MIYLDYNATTPVDPSVIKAMLPYFGEFYGNSSSRSHLMGWDAKDAVDKARKQVANLIKVDQKEIVFTSGATESINLAIKGLFDLALDKNHIITAKTEHKAVLDVCAYLEKYRGVRVTYLSVDKFGNIDLTELEKVITDETFLVSIMYANNETGHIHPLDQIAKICKKHHITLFSDATQAVGKIEVNPKEIGVDLMAFSSHKMYGPKGIGAIYIDKNIDIQEQQNGGEHERKRRSGTMNVPGIVGFGQAAEIATSQLKLDFGNIKKKRDQLEKRIIKELEHVTINGGTNHRLPHVSNLCFKGIVSEDLLLALSTHVALSSGSACNSASVLPSHVLTAMGKSSDDALASIRFSLGRQTTEEEIIIVIEKVITTVKRLPN